MAIYSKILELINGVSRTVDLSANTLSLGAMQLNGSTSGALTQEAAAVTSSYSIIWPAAQASGSKVLANDGSGNLSWESASAGSVTSVAFADDSSTPIYSVSGSPVTSTGTLAITLNNQNPNLVFAGPASGSAAQPSFRSLVSADIPDLSSIYLPLAGGTMSGAINMGGNQINDLGAPSVSGDAATKGYVDAAVNGLTWKGPAQAYAASNVPLTGSTPLVIDNYTVLDGDLLILGAQTTASQNGEYSAAVSGGSYTLTANGLPNAIGDAWLILNGTAYGDSAFVATAAVPAATFVEFAGPNAYSFTAPLMLSGNTVSITQASGSSNGYLSSTDWNTFNGKQAAGNYITALTGDATASGPGSATLTLATVNSNVGSFGSSTSIPSFTVNAKGLITAASGNAVVAPAGTLSGTTLNSTVVSSSLTSVGVISSGTWEGSAVGIAYGGTGQATAAAAFAALSPLTTAGDIIYENSVPSPARLGIGSTGQVLTVVAGLPAWADSSVSPSDIALTDGHILVGNGSNLAADVAMSGDVTISDTGATTIGAGKVTASKLGAVTDGVTLDQSGAGSTLEIKSAGVSATQLATGAFDQVTIVGGAGTPASVAQAPLVATSEVAGQDLTATTLVALRYALASDVGSTPGQMWLADNDASSLDNFYVIGLAFPASGVSSGSAVSVVEYGLINVPSHGFTTGAPLYLGSSGALTSTAPSSSGLAVVRVGQVKDANNIWVDPAAVGVN